jgi:hypothetical protein
LSSLPAYSKSEEKPGNQTAKNKTGSLENSEEEAKLVHPKGIPPPPYPVEIIFLTYASLVTHTNSIACILTLLKN